MRDHATTPRPRRQSVLLEVLAVLSFQALTLLGFRDHVDLHPADEALYQRRGQCLLDGEFDEGTLVFAPVYAAAYAPLRLLPLRGDAIQDTMGVLVVLATALSVWWALRALLPAPAAVLGAVWFGALLPVLASALRVYLFTAMLTTVALGCAARGQTNRAAAALALAALNRPELLPTLLLACAGFALLAWRRRQRRRLAGAVVVGTAGLALLLAMMRPELRHRQWFTFRWDYAAHFAPKDDVSYDEGVVRTRADALVADAFPGCRSLPEAARTNPGAVLGHVGRNLRLLPGNLWDLLANPWWHLPAFRTGALVFVGLAFAAGLLSLRAVREHRRADVPRTWNAAAAVVLLAMPVLLVPLVLFLPRPDYLMPLAVPLLVLLAWPIARSGTVLWMRTGLPGEAAVPAAVAAVAVLALAVPGPFVRPAAARCPNRDAVALLARHDVPADATVFATTAEGLRTLASGSFRAVELAALLVGEATPPADRPSFLLVGPADILGAAAERVVALALDPRWSLVDAGSECWLFARRT